MKRGRIAGVLISALLFVAMMYVGVFAASAYAKDSINDARNGSAVPFNTAVNGQLTSEDNKDYYKVVLNKSGRLTIDVHSDMEYLGIYLIDSDEDYTAVDYSMQKGDQTYTYDMAAGTYYLKFSDSTGTYSYRLGFTASGETYTQENNSINAVRNGSPVPFNTVINGQLAYNDNNDFFKVVLSRSGRLNIKVHSDIDYLSIYLNDSNEDYTTVDYSMQKGDQTYTYDMAAGTYYIEVSKSGNTGNYSFVLDFTASGETYTQDNNTINAVRNVKPIPLARKIKGQLAYNDREDFFKIVLSKPVKLKIKVHSEIEDLGIHIYDSKENYRSVDYGMPTGNKTYTLDMAAGTYYLEFSKSGNTGTYSFIVNPSVSRPAFKYVGKGKKKIRLKWKKVSKANGYVIQYAANKKFTKGRKQVIIKSRKTVSKTIKKLKAKKKYYVRIRAYRVYEGKKYYSSWSKVRIVKTK